MFKKIQKAAVIAAATVLAAAMMAGCGKVDGSRAVLTVNGEAISAGTANTYIRYQQAENYALMKAYGMITEGAEYWDTPYSEADTEGSSTTTTYGDYFKSQAKDALVKMALMRQHAAEYGVALTEEDQAAITEAAAKFIADNGSVAKWIGADQASVENLLSLYKYQNDMYDPMIADVDRNVSDEEAAQSTIIYAKLTGTMPDDFDGTEDEYAESVRTDMQKLLDEVLAMPAEEAETEGTDTEEADAEESEEITVADKAASDKDEITELAAGINESISVVSTSYGADSTLDEALLTAANSLSDGEVFNGLIETDNGTYIVKMEAVFDPEATESEKESIISERETERYTELLDSWVAEAQVTEESAWSKIKVNDRENYDVKST